MGSSEEKNMRPSVALVISLGMYKVNAQVGNTFWVFEVQKILKHGATPVARPKFGLGQREREEQ